MDINKLKLLTLISSYFFLSCTTSFGIVGFQENRKSGESDPPISSLQASKKNEDTKSTGPSKPVEINSKPIYISELQMITLEQRSIIDSILKDKGNLGSGFLDLSVGIDSLDSGYFLKVASSNSSPTTFDLEIGPKQGGWYFTCQIDITKKLIINVSQETIAEEPGF